MKYIAKFKKPCNFNCNSPQAKEHEVATPKTAPHFFIDAKYFVHGDRLFRWTERYYSGVINQRACGKKWEDITGVVKRNRVDVNGYLELIGAVEASFRAPGKSILNK